MTSFDEEGGEGFFSKDLLCLSPGPTSLQFLFLGFYTFIVKLILVRRQNLLCLSPGPTSDSL